LKTGRFVAVAGKPNLDAGNVNGTGWKAKNDVGLRFERVKLAT
jgi:hypothetical protein